MFAVAVVTILFCLAAANFVVRANWNELEDGVLWAVQPEGVVAAEVAAGTPGELAGLQPGDVLIAIDGRSVESLDDVLEAVHAGEPGTQLEYTVLRLGSQELRRLALGPVPDGNEGIYRVLAAVGFFTLLIGASVRVRRPGDQATLHFFWLTVAFFGVFAFSYSGRLDRLDWVFYWADEVSILLLPPLFMHFAFAFPERSPGWMRGQLGPWFFPLLYLPALLLGSAQVAVLVRQDPSGVRLTGAISHFCATACSWISACVIVCR